MNAVGGGSGGIGGTAGAATSKTMACLAYATAVCERDQECDQRPVDLAYCLQQVGGSCPDLIFSAGSKRTVAEALECAAVFRTMPCEQRNQARPACVSPGALLAGAPCIFPSQCESLSCTIASAGCGKCANIAARGQPCGTDISTECERGSRCSRYDSGTCWDTKLVPAGGACKAGFCEAELSCLNDVCTARPGIGEACPLHICRAGLDCVSFGEETQCLALPLAGQPCPSGACEQSAYCNTNETSPTCRALPAAGQPCLEMACAPGLRCQTSPVPVCSGPLPRGATCVLNDLPCSTGTACMCRDVQCSARSCALPGLEGAPCATPENACHSAFECVNQTCRARESQSIFQMSCGI